MLYGPILGILGSFFVVYFSLTTSTNQLAVYANLGGVLLVVGLTFTATLIAFPFKDIAGAFKNFFTVFTRKSRDINEVNSDLEKIYRLYREDPSSLAKVKTKNPFLNDCLSYLSEQIRSEDLRMLLEKRIQYTQYRYDRDVKVLSVMNKLPPAMGMLGTLIGLIAMLQGLGGKDMATTLGPSMAIALTTTLYGSFFSNMVIVPVIESIRRHNESTIHFYSVIADIVLKMTERVPAALLSEYIKISLPPSRRKHESFKLDRSSSSTGPKSEAA